MRMYDLILKKRGGGALSEEEIKFLVEGYTAGQIPEYQVSAFLMTVYFKGMDEQETAWLTHYMAQSGDVVDLSPIPGIKVDKHSTGGVGDKTSLIIGPIVAACGVPVAKMSGRGLGHTGGTIDKLEAIPGMQTAVERNRFFDIVRDTGIAIIGQTGNIAPADKKLYALRDVTATVDNLSLIASSIMSKKLAAGSDAILLDVKTGSGAFMKTLEESVQLAQSMVSIGTHAGKNTSALITNMDVPLGRAIGNSLEVIEAVETLQGNGPEDLTGMCLVLACNMLYLAEKGTMEECDALARNALGTGAALQKFRDMIQAQGGDTAVLDDFGRFPQAAHHKEVRAAQAGYIVHMHTEGCGIASVVLGAGRERKEDAIDYAAGILLHKKTGDKVEKDEIIAELCTNNPGSLGEAERLLLDTVTITDEKPAAEKLVYALVTGDSVKYY